MELAGETFVFFEGAVGGGLGAFVHGGPGVPGGGRGGVVEEGVVARVAGCAGAGGIGGEVGRRWWRVEVVVVRASGFGGLFPLGLLGVGVYVEPGGEVLVAPA